MSKFQLVLKQLRENIGLSQYALAKELGMPQSNIGMYESGKRMAPPDVLEKLADYFDVSVDYLLGRTDAPNIVIPENLHDPSVQYAFSDNPEDLSQDDWNKVSAFVEFLKSQKK